MVSISKSRVKPRKTKQQKEMEEKMKQGGMIFAGVIVTYMLLGSLFSSSPSDTSSSSSFGFRRDNRVKQGQGMEEKIQLNFDSELSASYKAIAFDILEFLNCERLLSEVPSDNNYEEEEENFENEMGQQQRRRRLQGNADDDNDDNTIQRREADNEWGENNNWNENEEENFGDDGALGGGGERGWMDDDFNQYFDNDYTAAHLFCLAAAGAMVDTAGNSKESLHVDYWKDEVKCDAAGSRQHTLLDLWTQARAEIDEKIFNETLFVAHETQQELFEEYTVNLWAPLGDNGFEYVLGVLNNQDQNVDHGMGSVRGLGKNLGPGHTFVDVGSCLGLTTLGVALLYPETRIVSIEPAAPNWFLQQINLRCNLDTSIVEDETQFPNVVLAGIGPQKSTLAGGGGHDSSASNKFHHQHTMSAKFMWRPSATTATRAWTPKEEKLEDDRELIVKLKSFYTLLEESGIARKEHIDVLNVDCEGCEYNLIPSLTEDEYEKIDTVMGGVHWGYIPQHKLPSSQRAKETHERLCRHENFARTSKECCAFPDMVVSSSVPGEVLLKTSTSGDLDEHEEENNNNIPGDDDSVEQGAGGKHYKHAPKALQQQATVLDVAGDLCDDFSTWSENNMLFNIENDFGWFQFTSMAN